MSDYEFRYDTEMLQWIFTNAITRHYSIINYQYLYPSYLSYSSSSIFTKRKKQQYRSTQKVVSYKSDTLFNFYTHCCLLVQKCCINLLQVPAGKQVPAVLALSPPTEMWLGSQTLEQSVKKQVQQKLPNMRKALAVVT